MAIWMSSKFRRAYIWLKAEDVFSIVLDFITGLVPVLGDIVDALCEANTRNTVMAEKYFREDDKKNIGIDWASTLHLILVIQRIWLQPKKGVG